MRIFNLLLLKELKKAFSFRANYIFCLMFYSSILFLVSIGAMSFGTSIYIYSTPILGPTKVSVFIFSVPFIALFTAYFVLSEKITYNVVIGGLISFISIAIVNKKKY